MPDNELHILDDWTNHDDPGIEGYERLSYDQWDDVLQHYMSVWYSSNFHYDIRRFLHHRLPCHNCKEPLCSCAGAYKTKSLFLPGERDWIETATGTKFANADEEGFVYCGDCVFLKEKKCQAGFYRPWDDISFPLQPLYLHGHLVPSFAKNCTIHPYDLEPGWILERWLGWKLIEAIIPDWLEWYSSQPVFLEEA